MLKNELWPILHDSNLDIVLVGFFIGVSILSLKLNSPLNNRRFVINTKKQQASVVGPHDSHHTMLYRVLFYLRLLCVEYYPHIGYEQLDIPKTY